MKMYRLIAGLCPPSEYSYKDKETIAVWETINQCIDMGERDTAIALLLNYQLDSDNITHFDCSETYVLDADLDGVYLYKRM